MAVWMAVLHDDEGCIGQRSNHLVGQKEENRVSFLKYRLLKKGDCFR